MYIQAQLLGGLKKPLTYAVPKDLESQISVGLFIHVPLRNYKTLAYITQIIPKLNEQPTFTIKEILEIAPFPADTSYETFIKNLSSYHGLEPLYFFKRMKSFLKQKEPKERDVLTAKPKGEKPKVVTLTEEQKKVTGFITKAITKQKFTPTLLHGVTGSGKTEVYKKLIEHANNEKKSILFLVPEVTLAVQFFHILKNQLPEKIKIFSFHSSVSAKEKKELWQALLKNKPIVIVGVHLPIMLPIKNLGLILVDEEHEVGYQEKKHPKINSKEAALLRAQHYNIPILLGSATPSITSLYQVKQKKWHFFELKQRFAGAFPKIKTVNLLEEKKRPIFWLSTPLEKEITHRLAKNEQTIIFLNRRGYSFFVVCKSCSHIFSCTTCSVSLTLHSDQTLRCHYCEYHTRLPKQCISCKAPETEFLKKGIGTQQLAELLQKRFPTARIGRADLDTTTNKKKWQQTLNQFERGDLDILVGTQTITKGYHFPNVTLVGIIWADANLHFPKYNATESALQQLIQVAGRAGRQRKESMVIVQTFADHPAFNYLSESDYIKFYEHEKIKRADALYPPFTRLTEIELKYEDEDVLDQEAGKLIDLMEKLTQENKLNIMILGPGTPPVAKIKNMHSRLIYIKSDSVAKARKLYFLALEKDTFKSKTFFTPSTIS